MTTSQQERVPEKVLAEAMSLYYQGRSDSAFSRAISWLQEQGTEFEDKQLMLRQFRQATLRQPPAVAEEWLRRLLMPSSPAPQR